MNNHEQTPKQLVEALESMRQRAERAEAALAQLQQRTLSASSDTALADSAEDTLSSLSQLTDVAALSQATAQQLHDAFAYYHVDIYLDPQAFPITLGANRKQILRKLLLPILLRKSWPTVVLYYLFVLGSFEVPLLLGRSNPEMVSVLVVRKLTKFNLSDKPEGYAIAFAYIVLMVLLVFLIQRKRREVL